MHYAPLSRFLGTAIALFATVMFATESADAAGTAADTTISNTVTLNYEVDSVAQTPVTDTVTFKVDNRIDLSIASSGATVTKRSPA